MLSSTEPSGLASHIARTLATILANSPWFSSHLGSQLCIRRLTSRRITRRPDSSRAYRRLMRCQGATAGKDSPKGIEAIGRETSFSSGHARNGLSPLGTERFSGLNLYLRVHSRFADSGRDVRLVRPSRLSLPIDLPASPAFSLALISEGSRTDETIVSTPRAPKIRVAFGKRGHAAGP